MKTKKSWDSSPLALPTKFDKLNPVMIDITVNKTAKKDSTPFSFGKRTVIYYELERIGSSYGTILLEQKVHHLAENDIFLRKPGQVVEGFMPYQFQYLTFQIEDGDAFVLDFLNSLPDKVNLRGNLQVQMIFSEIQALYLSQEETAALLIKARILELLAIFSKQARTSIYNRHIQAATKFIDENYCSEIGAADIAEQAGISIRYLFQQFKESLSDTPIAYLNRIRLEKGKALLLDTDLSILEIAVCCGYRSISYFDYVFKRGTGMSPSDFRKRYVLSK